MQKLRYDLSIQETDYYCVPAVVQAILRRHGHEESQEKIAESLKCTPENGTFLEEIRSFLKLKNLMAYFFHFDEVPSRIPELVIQDWIKKEQDLLVFSMTQENRHHTKLATYYDGKNLTILDPEDCRECSENLEGIYEHMRTTGIGGFGLVRKLSERVA